jgi:hypothetical protein
MIVVQINRVMGDLGATIVIQPLTCVGVDIEARKVAARDIDANAVAALEHERRRIHLDGELIRLIRLEHLCFAKPVTIAGPHNAVGYIEFDAVRVIRVGWVPGD